MLDRELDLFERLLVQVIAARQVAAFQRAVDPVGGLFIGPPGGIRAFGVVGFGAPKLVAVGIARDGHVARQAIGLAFEEILQPARRADFAQGKELCVGHGVI